MIEEVEREPYVTVTQGMRGFFAVLVSWNPEHGGFYEPDCSSPASHETHAGAVREAIAWAWCEGVRCAYYGPAQEATDEEENEDA